MDGELTIRPLDPDRELGAFLAVHAQQSALGIGEAAWRAEERDRSPERRRTHLVGELDGRIAAVVTMRPSALHPGWVALDLVVDRAARGRGHGRAMAAAVGERLAAGAATTLVAGVRDDDRSSRAWAERRGMALFDHTFESRLDLERFDPEPHREALERAAAGGLSIELCRDAERLYPLVLAVAADIPAVGLVPPTREQFEERVTEKPDAFTVVARDGGVLVGLATIVPAADIGWNWLTGVLPEHRGGGVARAVKAAAALEARGRGLRWLATSNNAVNAPMLAVNDALGYERRSGMLWMRRPIGPR